MTPDERSAVMALVTMPGRRPPLPPDEFLRCFGASDGVVLGLKLLREAVARHDPVDVELALIVCSKFGFTDEHLKPLLELAFADWHQQHENVANALGKIRSPASVNALVHLARWVPDYLAYDDARALATKSIWALGGICDDAARDALESLAHSPDRTVAQGAVAQLQK